MMESTTKGLFSIAKALETVHLARAIAEAGLGVAILKGPVLGQIAYGDVEKRFSADIDLLVRSAELRKVALLMEGRGYRINWGDASRLPEGLDTPVGAIPDELSFFNKRT